MRSPKNATQQQIAARLGISQTLVSRALAGNASSIGASKETVAKIRRVAASLNYVPSVNALALRGGPTRTLGVVVKDFDDPYFGRLIGALQVFARADGFSLLLSGNEPGDLTALQKHRVDGIIFAGSDSALGSQAISDGEKLPRVQIGRGPLGQNGFQVGMDEALGIRALVEHLAELGHQQIGFIGDDGPASARRAGHVGEALQALGLATGKLPLLTVKGKLPSDLNAAARRFLRMRKRPTAVIFADDALALSFMHALHQSGLTLPRDLSVVGIDDIPAASHAFPPLTTLAQPFREMAREAFRLLTGKFKGPRVLDLPGRVVIRASTGMPVRLSQ